MEPRSLARPPPSCPALTPRNSAILARHWSAVRALVGRRLSQWTDAEWPQWEELACVAPQAHERITGQEESLYYALVGRGQRSLSDPRPTDSAWDFDSLAEIQQRLPRLADLFPRRRYLKA
jgi:hypothetical protein